MQTIIRSTTLSAKFCNVGKRQMLQRFVDDYKIVLQDAVDRLFVQHPLPKFFSASSCETNITATALQAAGKQASQIIRGERAEAKEDERQPSHPNVKNAVVDFDERFVDYKIGTEGEFDIWLKLTKLEKINMRRSTQINVPLKRTKHFNKLLNEGWKLKKGIKFNPKMNCFIFAFEKVVDEDELKKKEGEIIGVDLGIVDCISDSRGVRTSDHQHPDGWTMQKVLQNLCRKHKGSNGFKRAQDLRDNFIGWAVNQLNLDGVRELKLEDLKGMKRGKNKGR